MKKAFFPFMPALRVTCPYGFTVDGVPGNTSKAGHLGRYALDFGGASGATMDWLTVPTAGAPLRCVRACGGTDNVRMFVTTEAVVCADGVIDTLCFECIHCGKGDLQTLGIRAGAEYAPGMRFYREGMAGTTANHVHIQVARGNQDGGWRVCASGYALDGEVPMHRVLFVPDDMPITGSGGYAWQRDTGEEPIGTLLVGDANYYRRTGPGTDCEKVTADGAARMVHAGELLAVYEMFGGWARITQDNGAAHWVSKACGEYEALPAADEAPEPAQEPDADTSGQAAYTATVLVPALYLRTLPDADEGEVVTVLHGRDTHSLLQTKQGWAYLLTGETGGGWAFMGTEDDKYLDVSTVDTKEEP